MALTVLDTESFPMIVGQQLPALAGRIELITALVDNVEYVLYDGATLVKNSLNVPVGKQVGFRVAWKNRQASGNLKGHVDFTLLNPSGAQVPLTLLDPSFQDRVASPGNGWILAYTYITIQAAGPYAGAVVLSGEAA